MIFQRDALNKVVCNIRTPIGAEEEVGTGIFITKSGTDVFLLTAAHVVKNLNDQSYIVISNDDGAPEKVLLSTLLGTASFTAHPQADLAKVAITITNANRAYITKRCLRYDHFDTSENLVSKDTELTTIGFPNGLGALGAKFSPLTFRTFVSGQIISLPRADNGAVCDFIILELPAVGGYSGGPVFDLGYVISGGLTTTKEKTLVHGIVHGTISDKTGGKLAAITPCKYLKGWL